MIDFDAETHTYSKNGIIYPSVTQIIAHFGFSNFDNVPPKILENAINFGNVVHKTIQLFEQDNLDEYDKKIKPIIEYWQWFKSNKMPKDDYLIDLKTGTESYSHNVQVFGYKVLIENSGVGKGVEKPLHALGYCGTPDMYNLSSRRLKRIFIVYLNLKKCKFVQLSPIKDVQYEDDFKSMLRIYKRQKEQKIL